MRGWRHRLAKLSQLSAAEFRTLCAAQGALLWTQLLVWVLPQGWLLRQGVGAEPRRCLEGELELALPLALAISRAAEHGLLRPTCLVRAIALERLLRRRGIEAGRVRVGVRMRGGTFTAHAWVELGDRVLGDEAWHVQTFTPVAQLHLAGRIPRTPSGR